MYVQPTRLETFARCNQIESKIIASLQDVRSMSRFLGGVNSRKILVESLRELANDVESPR